MRTTDTSNKLDTEPRQGRQRVNIVVDVSYVMGGDALINECYEIESDDHLFSAASALREMAERLDPRGY